MKFRRYGALSSVGHRSVGHNRRFYFAMDAHASTWLMVRRSPSLEV